MLNSVSPADVVAAVNVSWDPPVLLNVIACCWLVPTCTLAKLTLEGVATNVPTAEELLAVLTPWQPGMAPKAKASGIIGQSWGMTFINH